MIQFASHVAPASSAASVPKLAAIERTNHLVQEGRPTHDGLTPQLDLEVILQLGSSAESRGRAALEWGPAPSRPC